MFSCFAAMRFSSSRGLEQELKTGEYASVVILAYEILGSANNVLSKCIASANFPTPCTIIKASKFLEALFALSSAAYS